MSQQAPVPRFVVNRAGKKAGVLLSTGDYARLVAAWEEVADAADFAAARRSAKSFISVDELRRQVRKKRGRLYGCLANHSSRTT